MFGEEEVQKSVFVLFSHVWLCDGGLTCGRNDVVRCLTAKSGEQTGLPGACQTYANHVILWSGSGRSFTA